MNSNLEEQWRPIDGFPNYQVSNKGKVMNLKTGRVLKNKIDSAGYAFVALCKGDGTKPKNYKVHRLVAQAFIPNTLNLPQVDHIDERKDNNDVSNLRWVTVSENIKHSAHQYSCKINQLTLEGELIKVWNSFMEIERELGYSIGNIVSVCKGKYKQAYGYRWKYADGLNQQRQNRPVAVLTKDGDLIAEYKSAAEAARCLKISSTQIYFCLNGTCKSTHGLRFIYLD